MPGDRQNEMSEVQCAMDEKRLPDGDVIEGHEYDDIETHVGCTVVVSRCRRCGHQSIGWWYTANPPQKWSDNAS